MASIVALVVIAAALAQLTGYSLKDIWSHMSRATNPKILMPRVDDELIVKAVNAKTKSHIDKLAEFLIREKIDPWLVMRSTDKTVTLHDGKTYGFHGLEYNETVMRVFWDELIDPFLQEDIQGIFDEVGSECRANAIDPSAPLDEAAALLKGMVHRVYDRMISVDQRLRGDTGPKKVPREDVQLKIERMEKVVDEQLKIAKALCPDGRGEGDHR